jgi:hypothetical protein
VWGGDGWDGFTRQQVGRWCGWGLRGAEDALPHGTQHTARNTTARGARRTVDRPADGVLVWRDVGLGLLLLRRLRGSARSGGARAPRHGRRRDGARASDGARIPGELRWLAHHLSPAMGAAGAAPRCVVRSVRGELPVGLDPASLGVSNRKRKTVGAPDETNALTGPLGPRRSTRPWRACRPRRRGAHHGRDPHQRAPAVKPKARAGLPPPAVRSTRGFAMPLPPRSSLFSAKGCTPKLKQGADNRIHTDQQCHWSRSAARRTLAVGARLSGGPAGLRPRRPRHNARPYAGPARAPLHLCASARYCGQPGAPAGLGRACTGGGVCSCAARRDARARAPQRKAPQNPWPTNPATEALRFQKP